MRDSPSDFDFSINTIKAMTMKVCTRHKKAQQLSCRALHLIGQARPYCGRGAGFSVD